MTRDPATHPVSSPHDRLHREILIRLTIHADTDEEFNQLDDQARNSYVQHLQLERTDAAGLRQIVAQVITAEVVKVSGLVAELQAAHAVIQEARRVAERLNHTIGDARLNDALTAYDNRETT